MDLLSLGSIIFCSLSIVSYKKIKIENAIIIAIAILCGGGYIGGIFGNFLYGIIPLAIGMSVSSAICLIKKLICVENVFTTGFWFLISMTVISMAYHHNSTVTSWDDLASWAAATKNMFYSNQFACAAGNTIDRYTDYLPGVQLLSCIWMKVGNAFSDRRLFVSYNMLAYIFMAPFLSSVKKRTRAMLFALVLICAPNLFLANKWSMLWNLQIDTIVGVVFGYLIYIVYTEDYNEWNLYAGIFILSLSKQVGILFALVIVGLLTIKKIAERLQKERNLRSTREVLITIGEVLFVLVSWTLIKDANHVISTGSRVYSQIIEQGIGYFRTLESHQIKGFVDFWKCFIKYDAIENTSQTAYYITPFLKVSGVIWLFILVAGLIGGVKRCHKKKQSGIMHYCGVDLLHIFCLFPACIS